MSESLLRVQDLKVHFPITRGGKRELVRAVDGVSLSVQAGETLSLVGESGCGKTTTGRAILRLIEPTSGQVWFEGENLTALKRSDMRRYRRHLQIVFQDPYASLNPRMRVGDALVEAMEIHNIATKGSRWQASLELLEQVGLNPGYATRYPHEFSGGQRQRIGIARALAVKPRLIVCDEPVSALDVSVQAQVVNLLKDLQRELGLSYVFIAHDLSVVKHISHRIAVMYLGKVVEMADTAELFANPEHPYTQALLDAIPVPDPEHVMQLNPLAGELPSPVNPPSGCRFHPRCPLADSRCSQAEPLPGIVRPGHMIACHKAALADWGCLEGGEHS